MKIQQVRDNSRASFCDNILWHFRFSKKKFEQQKSNISTTNWIKSIWPYRLVSFSKVEFRGQKKKLICDLSRKAPVTQFYFYDSSSINDENPEQCWFAAYLILFEVTIGIAKYLCWWKKFKKVTSQSIVGRGQYRKWLFKWNFQCNKRKKELTIKRI